MYEYLGEYHSRVMYGHPGEDHSRVVYGQPLSPHAGVKCTDSLETGFSCGPCPDNYEGDGISCEKAILRCNINPCFAGSYSFFYYCPLANRFFGIYSSSSSSSVVFLTFPPLERLTTPNRFCAFIFGKKLFIYLIPLTRRSASELS